MANEVGSVVEYSRADVAKPSPVPTVTMFYTASGLAFDPAGDLWAANGTDVAEFTKAEIAKSGSPKPVFSVPDNCSVVFDSSGDLWEGSSYDWVLEFTRAQRCAGQVNVAGAISRCDDHVGRPKRAVQARF